MELLERLSLLVKGPWGCSKEASPTLTLGAPASLQRLEHLV